MTANAERLRPSASPQELLREWGPRLLVLVGATAAFASAIADYFLPGTGRTFSLSQGLGIVVGAATAIAGSALQVRLRQRTLAEVMRFWAIVAQVAGLAVVMLLYKIENRAFVEFVLPLIIFGFVVHHHLPTTLRHPFFFLIGLISVAGVMVVGDPVGGLWLIGCAFAIIGICLLPISVWVRVALLVIVAGLLAAARVGAIEAEWSRLILPILSAMFIFRAAIFLYDTANGKGPTNLWQRLSYFFLPPNVVFPFFPVVDFTTYGRVHYNEEANRIYQRGAAWMLRGLIHLMLYRIVYLYLVIPSEAVASAANFLQFITANFGLYLRISGLFHLIIGMLLLFGYNLPETHTRFYFSNSFIDFWRRINIYWKDFMQKMFFNPSFIRLKKIGLGETTAIALSMFVVFFATWALHAYQWFWLRGHYLLAPADMLFWGLLAVLLVGQLLLESRKSPSPRGAGSRPALIGQRSLLVVRTVTTFLSICILWSLWTSPSPEDWLAIWVSAGLVPAFDGVNTGLAWMQTIATLAITALIFLISMGVTFGLAAPAVPARRASLGQRGRRPPEHAWRSGGIITAAIVVLLAPHSTAVQDVVSADAREVIVDLSQSKLNAQDQAKRDQGYYEEMTDVNQFSSELWALLMSRPNGESHDVDAPMIRERDDLVGREYIPDSIAQFQGVEYHINRWGMRDDDVELAPTPGVHRVAIVGPSHVAGWGIEPIDRFDTLLEARMNAEMAPRLGLKGVETLNFAVEGQRLMQRIAFLDDRVWSFKPDTLIFTATTLDLSHGFLRDYLSGGDWTGYPFLDDLLREIGIREGMKPSAITRILSQQREKVATALLRYVADQSRARDVQVVWVFVPMANQRSRDPEIVALRRIAENAGLTAIDLSDVFERRAITEVETSSTDAHPNALGHRLIGEALFERLARLQQAGKISFRLEGDRMKVEGTLN